MNGNFKEDVYKVVRSVPKGRVTTYGEIAAKLGKPQWARQVGWVLHANKDSNTPCHRVVDRSGRLAPNFAFDGWQEQKRRLLSENVKFTDEKHVDLEKCLWST